MLGKTFTTFHASNMLLQQQYREHHFTKYSKLISCLLVVEQNNVFLLKNHQSCPTSLCHCLKLMPHLSKFLDMDKDMDMDEVKVKDAVKVMVDTILLIVVVLKV